jgi:4-alpha-glucanotransferase
MRIRSDDGDDGAAGGGPDEFSDKGQKWGMPIYAWEKHQETGFSWWIERARKNTEMYDTVRVDHIQGLVKYWEIPVVEANPAKGRWQTAKGDELFKALFDNVKGLSLIGENLGPKTPELEALMKKFNIPGMNVLQFGFAMEDVSRNADYPESPPCCSVWSPPMPIARGQSVPAV